MSEATAGQLVIAKSTDAAVFSDYKGAGLEKIVYGASKVGESLGVATGISIPGTGVNFRWIQLIYVQQTSYIFGIPAFSEHKLGYVPSDLVEFKDAQPSKQTTAGGTTPTTPGTTPTQPGNTPNADVTPTPGNDGKMTITANDKVITKKAVLPTWAYWALGGLGLTAAILIGVLVGKNKKGGKK